MFEHATPKNPHLRVRSRIFEPVGVRVEAWAAGDRQGGAVEEVPTAKQTSLAAWGEFCVRRSSPSWWMWDMGSTEDRWAVESAMGDVQPTPQQMGILQIGRNQRRTRPSPAMTAALAEQVCCSCHSVVRCI